MWPSGLIKLPGPDCDFFCTPDRPRAQTGFFLSLNEEILYHDRETAAAGDGRVHDSTI